MDQQQEAWTGVLLADLRTENEQLRALLEEASDLLSDAVDVALYGQDSSRNFSWYKAEDWERRYQALKMKLGPSWFGHNEIEKREERNEGEHA
jgi:hypothetical protein